MQARNESTHGTENNRIEIEVANIDSAQQHSTFKSLCTKQKKKQKKNLML